MDPIITPLLFSVFGKVAIDLVEDASKDYLKDKLKSVFGWLETIDERDKVELAYQDVMVQAYGACLEMLLINIKGFGYSDEELKEYKPSLERFVKDEEVADELLRAIREPNQLNLPSPDVLHNRWQALGGQELPSEILWNAVSSAFRRQAQKRIILSNDLRDILNAQNLQQLTELISRQGGVKIQVRWDRYSQRMRTKYAPVDLANLMPAYADDPGRMVIRDVFVAQNVRENPPPVELPKDLAEQVKKDERSEPEYADDIFDEQQLKKLRASYINQSPKSVLDVISSLNNRLIVLTGDPGSGKSTLMRYLLTGLIEPSVSIDTKKPLPWAQTFNDAFPLLIELRDFYALRRSNECDSFLEYVAYMGKTDQWFLDDHTVHSNLEDGYSLVMFDGLDEIFDMAERERIMHEIVGFAQRYPQARIIVTSRPVGYKEQILRNGGFAHFGIQDLDNKQIEVFIRGWFNLTFPQQPQQGEQRVERVLNSVQQSRSIRLLAGNPMLLTIMALLAREDELPRERAKFYEKAVEVLCHHWDANRNLQLPGNGSLNADDKKDLLRQVAMYMQAGDAGLKGNVIQENDLEKEIQTFLISEQWQLNVAEAKIAARLMIRQLRERNYILCLRGPRLYGFVHRTFLEYLTAAEYVHRFHIEQSISIDNLIDLFDQHCRNDEWHEVLRLICGQIDEQFVGRIIHHLATRSDTHNWDGKTLLSEVPLAIWCLTEIRNVGKVESSGRLLLHIAANIMQYAKWGVIALDHVQELLRASQELSPRLHLEKNEANRKRFIIQNSRSKLKGVGINFWSSLVAAIYPDREVIVSHSRVTAGFNPGFFQGRALKALADNWPDEPTRQLLMKRAVDDRYEEPRGTALKALADNWPDEPTRQLLIKRAVDDRNSYPRSTALEALADKWRDDSTRELLERRALEDAHENPRSTALEALADKWRDDSARELLERRALEDAHENPRSTALEALADKWRDDSARELLERRALEDAHENPRSTALEALADKWRDDSTRELLERRALEDAHENPRSTALEALADKWRDDSTRELLERRALEDAHENPRSTALEALADKWRDDSTRELLERRALEDAHHHSRDTALRTLVDKWQGESTRKLLEQRAVEDGHESLRITALEALADKWGDKKTRELLGQRAIDDEHISSRRASLWALMDKWGDEKTRKLATQWAIQEEDKEFRNAALRALADNWFDEPTRELLEQRAVEDEHESPRSAALRALADRWQDESTYKLLEQRAVEDEHESPRSAALQALADNWFDESTRELLEQRAVEDEHESPRRAALQALASNWFDEPTRELLEQRAVEDEHESPRSAALEALADNWFDEPTRELLEQRAVEDEHESPRSAALRALADRWQDESTYKLLEQRAVEDEHESPRSAALQALADNWFDESTRELLEQRAVEDEHESPRRAALQALASNWFDEPTRELLEQRAVEDEHESPRSAALEALADNWFDEPTRELLEQRAVEDEHESPRSAALRALADKWPSENTNKLLEESVHSSGFATAQVGGRHSQFGRIVFTRDLDGFAPYISPSESLARKHINQAAKKSNVLAHDVDDMIRSLSSHLGWNIEKGTAMAPLESLASIS